ncbi:MAG: hypothetical protein QNK05_04490 [Myxococcota bacterium]|nr:hypothetical protein [Myxococcota bacterium]
MSDSRLRRIRRARPFEDRLDIARIEPASGDAAHSGTAFFAPGLAPADSDGQGVRYKLRDCRNPIRAARLAHWIALLPEVVPALVARQGRYLLLEAVDDFRPITRVELVLRASAMGAIGARVHAAGRARTARDRAERALLARIALRRFRRELGLLVSRGALTPALRDGALRKFEAHHRSFGLPMALELDDIHKGNWMMRESDEALRYVDEEGLGLRPKGMGLASLLKTATRLQTWRLYKRGYAEVADDAFLTMPYTEYLLLIDTVRRVAHKVRTDSRIEKLPTELSHLRALAETPEVNLSWRFPKGDN